MHKKVAISELFFDLVYVYAIGQSTELLHHLHHGTISWTSLLVFLVTFLFLITIWVFQTFFVNLFGQDSPQERFFLYLDMALILLVSNSFSLEWQGNFIPFSLLVLSLTSSLALQFFLASRRTKKELERRLARTYLRILVWRFSLVLTALLLYPILGIYPFLLAFMIGLFLLYFYRNALKSLPFDYEHLLERFTLLVIIAFGEMVMSGISDYFRLESFSLETPLVFLLVILLFHIYHFEFYQHIHCLPKSNLGLRLVYVHYPILLGLSMVTVALAMMKSHLMTAPNLFLLLYSGLGLYLLGILWQNLFHRPRGPEGKKLLIDSLLLYLISFLLGQWQSDKDIFLLLSSLLFLSLFSFLHRYYSKN
ncbi:low temperature requirement protein A [Streptococcus loxodontisalivarius]|uniref:Low temperature requirement protein LtrA n=1 Tax=Streptococcus loxodontisalivarius TaxID=1349415 RepID=A0ABS2PS36_9STRE|nr:low temperature requirement protein LtrA [Streptococcus loxodontisalivarius]